MYRHTVPASWVHAGLWTESTSSAPGALSLNSVIPRLCPQAPRSLIPRGAGSQAQPQQRPIVGAQQILVG